MNSALLLDMAADAAPERLGFGPRARALTLAETQRRAAQGAAWLKAYSAETVAFVGLNGPALAIALFASSILARPFAPLNYRLPDADLTALLARTAPSVAIVDDDMIERLQDCAGVKVVARSAFEAACEKTGADTPVPDGEQDIGVLLFTSGTTGTPKAAILRNQNLFAYVVSTVEFLSADETDAALVSVPPYHIAGISAILTGCYGGRRTVHLESFSPQSWVDMALVEHITHAMVVPTMLGRILDELEARGATLPALKALSYGGGRMPPPLIKRALAMLPHVDFTNAYGLTETSSTVSILGPEDHRAAIASDDPKIQRRLESVGLPLPSLEVEIRSPDGAALGANVSGEIYVRGEQVAGEYTHKNMLTADGWLATNDGGFMDENGYLFIEGRLDDVIVRGGENISPGEIEDVLRQHDNVADVAVLGVPDNEWGERIAAFIVAKGAPPSTDELALWVKARLRSTKTPELWTFREALPYNDMGKLLRRQLKLELTAGATPN